MSYEQWLRQQHFGSDPPASEPMPAWVLQPVRNDGLQLVRLRANREPGPRLFMQVTFTTGQDVDQESKAQILETTREMIQETFLASCDYLQIEGTRLPRPLTYQEQDEEALRRFRRRG